MADVQLQTVLDSGDIVSMVMTRSAVIVPVLTQSVGDEGGLAAQGGLPSIDGAGGEITNYSSVYGDLISDQLTGRITTNSQSNVLFNVTAHMIFTVSGYPNNTDAGIWLANGGTPVIPMASVFVPQAIGTVALSLNATLPGIGLQPSTEYSLWVENTSGGSGTIQPTQAYFTIIGLADSE